MTGRIPEAEWIWRDGEFIPSADAQVHVLSLAVQFGSSVFEGMRCYDTPDGPAIFCMHEHLRRLFDSCKVYRIELPHTADDLAAACTAVVERNGLEACYIRPTVVRGYGASSMVPKESPIETFIAAWPWGAYLGEEALSLGVDVCVSSWQRMQPNTFPAISKAAGHYTNAQLIKMEAMAHGYAEAIALGPGGVVSEGSGQNLFLVRDGAVILPDIDGTSLQGITQAAIMTIAKDLSIPVRRETVPRETLYIADELFFTGTATEVTPIRSVDRITIGEGRAGPITRQLQQQFLAIVHGKVPDTHGWLTHVKQSEKVVEASG